MQDRFTPEPIICYSAFTLLHARAQLSLDAWLGFFQFSGLAGISGGWDTGDLRKNTLVGIHDFIAHGGSSLDLQERIVSLPEVTSLQCVSATLIAHGARTKPDLFRLSFDDGRLPLVLKTYALKHFLVRLTAGWFVTRREYRLLCHLKGLEGICQIAWPASRLGLFIEWIPGQPLSRFPNGLLPHDVFHQLSAIVTRMHQAGVVHLDIAHRGNIMVTPEGKPVIIDFQSGLYIKGWPSLVSCWLRRIDELTVIKWKEKHFRHLLTSEEREACRWRQKLRALWPFSR